MLKPFADSFLPQFDPMHQKNPLSLCKKKCAAEQINGIEDTFSLHILRSNACATVNRTAI